MKKVFELLDDAKEEHGKLQIALDEGEVTPDLLAGWIGAELTMLTELIKKVEELEERMNMMRKR
jgi:hypothetical protein